MNTCFVVSPIGEENSSTRANADKLCKHIIKPVCEACGFEAVRVDQLNDASSITQTIIDQLDNAELVIADITEHNPNVFFEIGYRTRTKKPIIYLKSKGEKLPFDVTTIRAFDYDLTDLDNVEEIRTRLEKTIQSFDFTNKDGNKVKKESECATLPAMPILYQILDEITKLESKIEAANTGTIETVIRSMQKVQPQVSPDTALQMQLLTSLMQNPEGFLKLLEISEKLQTSKKK